MVLIYRLNTPEHHLGVRNDTQHFQQFCSFLVSLRTLITCARFNNILFIIPGVFSPGRPAWNKCGERDDYCQCV